ncbi:Pyrrolo-quinoline quinone [Haloterrigena turkmenica DSM 5511]|uniref:Pyrrolo-quinoline quinone n=1 Tax=Haloterrigena turkmenica (strain ATCC 51198 / DSM 5511 / JCM 9101 / NCIMB 13204 / VKM B-1734 / 4k) TaxID=543526 RepID=D2RQ23_HALTV|nr:PQQ-binding-like beta-propeller repeat protein [Haloterrigena turkmenica]ADB60282.1 Pyrrolo-quinoline quinone [Haloterrigena turkmenica DSM 5511]
MTEYDRRDVLKYVGVAVATGAAASETGAARSTDASAPADWPTRYGDADSSAAAPETAGPEPPVAIDWTVERGGRFAAAGDRLFLVTDDGRVAAYDAANGDEEWITEVTVDGSAVAAVGAPAADHDAVYVTTAGDTASITALEAADGERRWQESGIGYETNRTPVVGEDLVLVVADGSLFAFDARDGTREWRFDPEPVTVDGGERGDPLQRDPVAVGDGAVFAVSNNQLFARELDSGAARWADRVDDWAADTFSGRPMAHGDAVAVVKDDAVAVYDAGNGDERATVPTYSPAALAADRLYAVDDAASSDREVVVGYDRASGADEWRSAADAATIEDVIVGDGAVFAAVADDGESGAVAFDRDGGDPLWRLETDFEPSQLAVVDGTVYASGDRLVAIRSEDDGEPSADDGEPSADDGDPSADDGNPSADNGEPSADDEGSDGEGAPGFTVGTGIVSGVLALAAVGRRVANGGD